MVDGPSAHTHSRSCTWLQLTLYSVLFDHGHRTHLTGNFSLSQQFNSKRFTHLSRVIGHEAVKMRFTHCHRNVTQYSKTEFTLCHTVANKSIAHGVLMFQIMC